MKRYERYASALEVLKKAPEQDLENEFVLSGIVDKFSLQFELGWKLLKALLAYEGEAAAATGSPRDILKAAYTLFDFVDEDLWLSMLRDRNTIAHVYDEAKERELVDAVIHRYIPAFQQLQDGLVKRYGESFLNGDLCAP